MTISSRASWILASMLTAVTAFSAGRPPQPTTRAFIGATIFDGTGAPGIPNAVLVVRDGRMVAVGPAASTSIPDDAERVDVPGRFIIPGLIEEAHALELRVAAHIFYLEDAKDLLRAGVDFIAHSVRDLPVDKELIDLMKARDVCLSPTLMREVSTFIYESRPAFFDDPFFTREADPKVMAALEDPKRQEAMAQNRASQAYKKALEVARANVKALHDGGVRIASGTDSGPPARFQGYFEHVELEELVRSGLTPAQALAAGTGTAARCMGLGDRLGTLAPGRAADLVVLSRDPLQDIRNTRAIESVWIAGNRVPAGS